MSKRKLKLVSLGIATVITLGSLTGCGRNTGEDIKASMDKGETIALSVNGEVGNGERQPIEWVELDQLNNYKEFRDGFDYTMNIVKFDLGSKNGVIYADDKGAWTGNNTLFNTFKNKEFVKNYDSNKEVQTELKEVVNESFGTAYNLEVGYIAALNTYFNILPNLNKKGKGDTDVIMETISRKDAMTALVRCDTPVRYLTPDNNYNEAFGNDEYNKYAIMAEPNSFLQTSDGSLNAYTYNSPITYGEMIYMIMSRYYPDEVENTTGSLAGYERLGDIWKEYNLEKGSMGNAYELETALQRENVIPDKIYNAMVVAQEHGVVNGGNGWKDSVMLGNLLTCVITTYRNMYTDSSYPVNALSGKNEGNELIQVEEVPEPSKEQVDVGSSEVNKEEIREADEIDKVIEKYKDIITMSDEEIEELKKNSEGFTFEWVDTHLKVDYCDYLNLRMGPSTDYPILRSIPWGTETHIIARCVENGWYRVIADGVVAYQCGYYFSDIE